LYRAVNTLHLGYKCEALNVKYIVPARSKNTTKHKHAICGQNIEFFTLDPVVHKVKKIGFKGVRGGVAKLKVPNNA
jgi:hypothetical protein